MSKKVMNPSDIERTYRRFAMQFMEAAEQEPHPAIIGMQTRGVYIARRIHAIIEREFGISLNLGILDTTYYRDDFRSRLKMPEVQITDIPFDLYDRDIILVDDVLYTGRTIRSAMDAVMAYGRPRSIRVCCMVDRGHRELPIQGDMIGVTIPTHKDEEVRVKVKELDGEDAVYLVHKDEDVSKEQGQGVTSGHQMQAYKEQNQGKASKETPSKSSEE
jgi:pyrimidine operon attenuation protein/uracil phosphoribosyltransferase